MIYHGYGGNSNIERLTCLTSFTLFHTDVILINNVKTQWKGMIDAISPIDSNRLSPLFVLSSTQVNPVANELLCFNSDSSMVSITVILEEAHNLIIGVPYSRATAFRPMAGRPGPGNTRPTLAPPRCAFGLWQMRGVLTLRWTVLRWHQWNCCP